MTEVKPHRHTLHLSRERGEKPDGVGYMHCDLCGARPTVGVVGGLRYNTPSERLKAQAEGR